jgi:hypothetical protein
MKEELKFYYPELPQDSIQITGTPQFDFYSDPSLIQSREDFAAEFGLDSSKHWILFSGDDIKTSPYDADYLRDIANALKDEENLQILFRQVPVETTERYKSVLQTFPNIVHISPFWKRGEFWQQFFPYPKDLSHLVNLAFHCDTVINLGSTMALDFAFFDKPALYLNYDHTPGQTWTVKEIYGFQHFRSMDGLDPVGWISDPNTILSQVKKAIDFPQEVGKDRRKWLEKIVNLSTEKTASAKIAAFINQLVPNLQTK